MRISTEELQAAGYQEHAKHNIVLNKNNVHSAKHRFIFKDVEKAARLLGDNETIFLEKTQKILNRLRSILEKKEQTIRTHREKKHNQLEKKMFRENARYGSCRQKENAINERTIKNLVDKTNKKKRSRTLEIKKEARAHEGRYPFLSYGERLLVDEILQEIIRQHNKESIRIYYEYDLTNNENYHLHILQVQDLQAQQYQLYAEERQQIKDARKSHDDRYFQVVSDLFLRCAQERS